MPAPVTHTFPFAVKQHAFNRDRSQVVVCTNSNTAQIYAQSSGGSWTLLHTLAEHDLLVTGVDWAPNTNRIVTCGQDKNAYVWSYESTTDKWKPEAVLLRLNRAATSVRWSPNEDKFATTSGAKCVAVCYRDQENNWWTAKHIKKEMFSTTLSLAWHPGNILLAVASADAKVRVYSTYIKEIEAKPTASPWGSRLPLGAVMAEYSSLAGGFVHDVAFSSADPNQLAFVSHDAILTVVDKSTDTVSHVRTPQLPILALAWLDADRIIAAGHDCSPMVFKRSGSGWTFGGLIDKANSRAGSPSRRSFGGSSAINVFREMDSYARQGKDANDSQLPTVHQNAITSIHDYDPSRKSLSTSGMDGILAIWDFNSA
ncbi:putative actin-related protein 2/3 complex subunit 1A [Ramicandelaber brevisporus]|nr:putative actin-related protein 2/3 complex subunit 1A [Ramicandelaber brevisporus]